MHLPEKELSVENYKKLGLRDLEQLYTVQVIPHLNKSIETINTLLGSEPGTTKTSEENKLAVSITRKFLVLYNNHAEKEIQLLSNLGTRHTDKVLTDIPKLIKSHKQLLQMLEQISELAEQRVDSESYSPLHKLGHAHIHNLKQDIARLFFLEEEYLFPRLRLLLQNK